MKNLQLMKVGVVLGSLLGLSFACGETKDASSEMKIRQGQEVSVRSSGPERVSTVGLVGFGPQGQYTCSAALIGSQILATAAHCIPRGAELYAFFGTDVSAASASDFIPVDGIRVHPDYRPGAAGLPAHDVAIVHLSRPVPRGFVPLSILPDDSILDADEQVLLAGYGITEYGNDSGLLRATWATFAGLDSLGRLQINDPEKHGACSGDSGGPLFVYRNGKYYAAGVLSGGPIPCRGINVYTSLAQHRSFIQTSVNQLK